MYSWGILNGFHSDQIANKSSLISYIVIYDLTGTKRKLKEHKIKIMIQPGLVSRMLFSHECGR